MQALDIYERWLRPPRAIGGRGYLGVHGSRHKDALSSALSNPLSSAMFKRKAHLVAAR